MIKNLWNFTVVLFLVLTVGPLTPAQGTTDRVIAILTEVEGQVTILRPSERGAQFEGEPDTDLKPGDIVTTSDGSSAEISFDDESTITLEERSKMQVEDLRVSPNPGRQVTLRFMVGRLWAVVKNAVDGGHQMTVRTPSAVASVKGTEFGLEMVQGSSELGVFDGQVRIAGLDPKGQEVEPILVKASEETSVGLKAKPGAPRAFGQRWAAGKERLTALRGNTQMLRDMKKKGELRPWREMRRLMFREGKGKLPPKDRKQLDQFRKKNPGIWSQANNRMKTHFEKRKQWEQRNQKNQRNIQNQRNSQYKKNIQDQKDQKNLRNQKNLKTQKNLQKPGRRSLSGNDLTPVPDKHQPLKKRLKR